MRLPRQWNERSLNVSYRTEKSRVHGCQESGFRNKIVESNSLLHGAYSCPTLHSLLQALHRVQPLSFPIASIILVTSTPTALEGFTLASRCWWSQAEMYSQQDGVNPCSQTLSTESSKDKYPNHSSVSQFTKEFDAYLSLYLPSLFLFSVSNQNLKTFNHYNIFHWYAFKSVKGD